jgi:hypothetical protein
MPMPAKSALTTPAKKNHNGIKTDASCQISTKSCFVIIIRCFQLVATLYNFPLITALTDYKSGLSNDC